MRRLLGDASHDLILEGLKQAPRLGQTLKSKFPKANVDFFGKSNALCDDDYFHVEEEAHETSFETETFK